MRKLINEVFNYKTGYYTTNKGIKRLIAYIDASNSENTYKYKDKLKNEFGAMYSPKIGKRGAWVWWLNGPNDPKIDNVIKPAIEFLTSVEQPAEKGGKMRNFLDIIERLKIDLANANDVDDAVGVNETHRMTKDEINKKLDSIKEDIISSMSSDEFLRKIAPILKLRAASGYKFSLKNTLLIFIQDPQATDVRSGKNWREMNREILPNAKMVSMFVPRGKSVYKSKEEKQDKIKKFVDSCGKNSEKELTPGEKERLRILLDQNDGTQGFKFAPYWCDVRFTKQMEGKEVLIGDNDSVKNIKWNDYDADENEYMRELINAAVNVAKKVGLDVTYHDEGELNGAKGYATSSGKIVLIKNAPQNIGMLNTVIHETAHEFLHFSYLKSKNDDVKDYFVGTSQGRGLVEQQAELTALIVLKELNLNSDTSLNYISIWGGDKKNASAVFDTVAYAATYITNEILKQINNESEEDGQEGA